MRWLALALCIGCSAPMNGPRGGGGAVGNAIRARIEHGQEGSWVDIIATGPIDQARALCERVAASQLQLQASVARPCAPDALPSVARAGGALLVEVDRVIGDVPEASARVETFLPFPDRAACERMRAQLAADDTRRREDAERARHDELARRIQVATDDRDRACGAVAEEDARCATHKGDERAQCNAATEPKRVVCRDLTRRREELDRPPSPPQPLAARVCR